MYRLSAYNDVVLKAAQWLSSVVIVKWILVVLYVYNIILTFFYHPRDKRDMEAREICRQDKKNSGIDNFAMNWERLSRGIICVRKVWNKKQGF